MSARTYEGPVLFSYGFRPFFLLGSIYAAFAILVWLPAFMGELKLVSAFIPRDWHVHEMLYGYSLSEGNQREFKTSVRPEAVSVGATVVCRLWALC